MQHGAATGALPFQEGHGLLFGVGSRSLQLPESQRRLHVEDHQFKLILGLQLVDESTHALFGEQEFAVIRHAARDIEEKNVIHPVLGFRQVVCRR